MRLKKHLLSLLIFLCPAGLAMAADAPAVVISIKPIHALVAGLMQGVAEPELLVKGGGSPHGYSLRPSQARALANADLVVWVGPQLESFLSKPLATLASKAHQLELLETIEGPLLALRKGGAWEGHAHGHDAEHHGQEDEHQGYEMAAVNTHIWLSPLLAKQIVAHTAQVLSRIDPAHQGEYAQNAAQLQDRLDQLHRQLKNRLAPVKSVPYVVFHDAYHYFENAYGLNAVGSITLDPQRAPGAKRIADMRTKIKDLHARCVFSEPQFKPQLVQTVIEGTNARSGTLDPLGSQLPEQAESYFALMNQLVDNLLAGLAGAAQN